MISGQLLKAALHEALTVAAGGGPVLYFPLGAQQAIFDITDTEPSSAADFSNNQARMLISGPVGGDYPVSSNYAALTIQFAAYSIAKPDCGFLAEVVADWVGKITADDLPMSCQSLEKANVVRFTGPQYLAKADLNFASFDVRCHLALA